MPFPSSPTVGQTYTTPGGVTFEWVASGYWKAVGGGGATTPAPSGVTFPTWTTATRPASPTVGQSGLNTDLGFLEVYDGAAWDRVGNIAFFSIANQPSNQIVGDEWLDSSTATLNKYLDLGDGLGARWVQIRYIETFTGSITPASFSWTNGVAVAETIVATGGMAPYTFTVSVGTLPTGVTLAADGSLSGTPTTAENYSFSVTVTDADGAIYTQAYTGIVAAGPFSGSITPASFAGWTVNDVINETLSTTGGTAPYTYSMASGALPTGLTLDSATGALTGTLTTDGTFNFTITSTAANGATYNQAYSIAVASNVVSNVYTSSQTITVPAGATISLNGRGGSRTSSTSISNTLRAVTSLLRNDANNNSTVSVPFNSTEGTLWCGSDENPFPKLVSASIDVTQVDTGALPSSVNVTINTAAGADICNPAASIPTVQSYPAQTIVVNVPYNQTLQGGSYTRPSPYYNPGVATFTLDDGRTTTHGIDVLYNNDVSTTTFLQGSDASVDLDGNTYTFPGQSQDGSSWNFTTFTTNSGSDTSLVLTIPPGGEIEVSYAT